MTDRYGVIGHPISHSKSPVIHRLFAAQTGEDISYEAFDIPEAQLEDRLRELVAAGMRGLNVTVPHKEHVARIVDQLTDRAHLAGAVNTVTIAADGRLDGDNTDGVGLLTDLSVNLGVALKGARILVLGAGGATRGIAPALLGSGPESLHIANRTVERARELAARFERLGMIRPCRFEDLAGQQYDIVINATSAGLKGELPPFPSAIIGPETICYDLAYAMTDTPFVAWASHHGARQAHQGWGMLVEQAAESFFIWRGVRPDTAPVREKLP
ncbi:MAG: shikimate dehydrogenase [Gammaproteobacteria bacterium]|jgi:shikimate dehydrogenase|nr:shikimate dehydrogenase [Gammaproteobacteria bacterium]